MRLARRRLDRWMTALFHRKHYVALYNMVVVCPRFADVFRRYLLNSGTYPYEVQLRTPVGPVSLTLYSYHDLLTVNEVFCRQDYRCKNISVVVDIGANIGISALYFLTRNDQSRVYLFEPVPQNVERLNKTLQAYGGRYFVTVAAVADKSGVVEFAVEASGRYGTLYHRPGDEHIQVDCQNINAVLADVLALEQSVDVLKLDTEGFEEVTVAAIDPQYFDRIREIFYEASFGGGAVYRRSPGTER
jgi:FkbM family methyltransferase